MRAMTSALLLAAAAWAGVALVPAAGAAAAPLHTCRLPGVEHEAWCGRIERPLDPASPTGRAIEVHYAVLPALARNKKPDPVFVFAGGPGQSAIALAGPLERQLSRALNRRDVVLVDQRGTGRSAPLQCDEQAPTRALREAADPQVQAAELVRCREALQKLPHGDLRQYTTTIAIADIDAVRQALGAEKINVMGASYGTRAALEYMRQFPQRVRRAVIDGVAPPDMALPAAFSTDAQAAFDAVLAACEGESACHARHPQLRTQWRALADSLPRTVNVPHPVTGRDETLVLTREMLLSLVRGPLYMPALASALPHAVAEAAQGRFVALVGLASAMSGGREREMRMAAGMHFSVVCAEDMPRVAASADQPGADFGSSLSDIYRRTCEHWPRGAVPPEFYRIPPAAAPVLVLSGGIDPVTPPRHGERAAQALGAQARHIVVPNAGHGVMAIGCMRDVIFRFIDAADDEQARRVDAGCARAIPRPPAFAPVAPAAGSAR
jgi:pimeloyl-ACP methyl ester carboxylesterase